MHELNFPEPIAGDVKLKIKTIRAVFASELAKIINSETSGASLHDMYVPKLFWFKQTFIPALRVLFLSQPLSQQRLSSK